MVIRNRIIKTIMMGNDDTVCGFNEALTGGVFKGVGMSLTHCMSLFYNELDKEHWNI